MQLRNEEKVSILVSDTPDYISEQSFKVGLFDNFNIIGLVDNSEKTFQAFRKLKPDLLLLGYEVAPIGGIQICEQIKSLDSEANVIITTERSNSNILAKALSSGARGICLKETEPGRLRVGLECVNKGEIWIDEFILDPFLKDEGAQKIKKRVSNSKIKLTDREISILKLVASGYSNKKIGEQLYLSSETVKFHLTRIKKTPESIR